MPINPLYTHELISAYEQLMPPTKFLQYRYFGEEIVYNSHDIIAEYTKRSRRPAPFVVERHNGIPVARGSYDITTLTPPRIKLYRTLSADDLEMKGFGEALYSQLTPEQRQQIMLANDLLELDEMIARREELMCADIMLNNSVTVKGYADDLSGDKYEEKTINFFTEDSNPASLSVSPAWDAEGGDILGTLRAAVAMKTALGQRPDDLVCAPGVAEAILMDNTIYKLLDNRRMTLGEIDPKLLDMGVALYGQLDIGGYLINIISYGDTYQADDGSDAQYIPAGHAVLASTNSGVRTYGRIAQVETEGGPIVYHANKRVPKYVSSVQNDTRQIYLSSRPLPLPREKNTFISMEVLSE